MNGFTLALRNPPAGAVLWNANFAENTFNYEPMADSLWLPIDSAWNYPSDPRGCTTLRVWILDANSNILLDVHNLGPVNNGKNYVFDCASQQLVTPADLGLGLAIAAAGLLGVGALVLVAAMRGKS